MSDKQIGAILDSQATIEKNQLLIIEALATISGNLDQMIAGVQALRAMAEKLEAGLQAIERLNAVGVTLRKTLEEMTEVLDERLPKDEPRKTHLH